MEEHERRQFSVKETIAEAKIGPDPSVPMETEDTNVITRAKHKTK